MENFQLMPAAHPMSLIDVRASEIRFVDQCAFLSDLGDDPSLTYTLRTEVEGPLLFSVTVSSGNASNPAIYLDFGQDFSEENKVRAFRISGGCQQFLIDEGNDLKRIRYDPSDQPCTLCIDAVSLRCLAEEERLCVRGCLIERFEGMTLGLHSGISHAITDDPKIYFALNEELKQLPFALVEFRATADAMSSIDPTLYLREDQGSAVPLWRDGDSFKALVVAPANFAILRLDPSSCKGRFHITRLVCRPLSSSDGNHDIANLYARANEIKDFLTVQTSLSLNRSESSSAVSIDSLNDRRRHEEWIRSCLLSRSADVIADIEVRLNPSRHSKTINVGPLISILTPVYDVDPCWLRLMVESVRGQTYGHWELCLVDDCSTNEKVRELLAELADEDERLKVSFRIKNGGISVATNEALAMANGMYVALVDNDDVLTCDALAEMVSAIQNNESPDWLYSDEFKVDRDGVPSQLFAKPDWSPIMLLNYMYTGHLSIYRTELVRSIGGFRSEFDLSQDYDLALRIADRAARVVHVEKYLYGWRMIEGSGSQGGKPKARLTNIMALQDASDRRGWERVALALPTANRLLLTKLERPKVSIVIPSDNVENISTSICSIAVDSSYKDYEIIVVAKSDVIERVSNPVKARARWIVYDSPYNFSDKCNVGARAAEGSVVVFFNDDVRVRTANWIEVLLETLALPGVGAVGPKLLYENELIQHAGMVTGVRRLVGTAFHCYPSDTTAHFNMAQCVREVSLICAALIALPLDIFHSIGGFDATNTPINHSDVDLCFKVRAAGYSCVYTPYASMLHIGHVSLAEVDAQEKAQKTYKKNDADAFILERWNTYLSYDPYFTTAMRNLIYLDSTGSFTVSPGKSAPARSKGFRTLIVSHDLSGSGAPKVAFDLALSMKEFGHFVVVVSAVAGPFANRLVEEGITVIIDENVLDAAEDSMTIARGFDNVIANTALCWRVVADLSRYTNVFWYVHETGLVRHLADRHAGFAASLATPKALWAGSKRAAEGLLQYGANPQILEYGVDEIDTASTDKESVKIVLVGSYEPRKAHDLFVLGIRELSAEVRSRARFRLFGRTLDTGFRDAVEGLASGIGEIEISHELSFRRYREEIEAADIVVVPSRDDTLPLVSLDALALGKALICSCTTGTSAYLEHERSALLLSHNTPIEIADCLNRLITDPEIRRSVGQGARAVFEKNFTLGAFRERLGTFF